MLGIFSSFSLSSLLIHHISRHIMLSTIKYHLIISPNWSITQYQAFCCSFVGTSRPRIMSINSSTFFVIIFLVITFSKRLKQSILLKHLFSRSLKLPLVPSSSPLPLVSPPGRKINTSASCLCLRASRHKLERLREESPTSTFPLPTAIQPLRPCHQLPPRPLSCPGLLLAAPALRSPPCPAHAPRPQGALPCPLHGSHLHVPPPLSFLRSSPCSDFGLSS